MDYQEFKKRTLRLNSSRNHKITNSLGVYDCYKHMRKNNWYDIPRAVKEKEFYAIIRSINKLLAKELAQGKEIRLPHRLGILELRKVKKRMKIVNGKLVYNNPIDWDATLRLWYKDEEAFKEKIVIKREVENIYFVHYNKGTAIYNNKRFYEFNPTREIKKLLKDNIEKGIIDAFLLYKIKDNG